MILEHRLDAPAPKARVWSFVLNVPSVAECIPGVESLRLQDDGKWLGELRVKVGPIAILLAGTIKLIDSNESEGVAVYRLEGADRRIGSAVNAVMRIALTETGPTSTRVDIRTDATLIGKLGELGQPIIRKKADSVLAEFAERFQKTMRDGAAG
ncbi:MAG: SRPBCC domain-containing protein [Dehalococcoidia bacterium]|nr:SRPBCC domain-containing protein [Dehalococcoidia bacterium]